MSTIAFFTSVMILWGIYLAREGFKHKNRTNIIGGIGGVIICIVFIYIINVYGVRPAPKTEYKIELINQQQVRINNDTIQFENIEEYIEKDNL